MMVPNHHSKNHLIIFVTLKKSHKKVTCYWFLYVLSYLSFIRELIKTEEERIKLLHKEFLTVYAVHYYFFTSAFMDMIWGNVLLYSHFFLFSARANDTTAKVTSGRWDACCTKWRTFQEPLMGQTFLHW